MQIREEQISDYLTVEWLIKEAFDLVKESDHQEHLLVQRLRMTEEFISELSLVAEKENEIVGHILFSPIEIHDSDKKYPSLALAPVSVSPKCQRQGIGTALIHEGLRKAKALGFSSVIVLGHASYYPRFGFKPARHWGIFAPFEIADECFMALPLQENGLDKVSGKVIYPSTFFE